MDIGGNIKNWREEKSISQTELAKSVGVSQPLISQIEKGLKIPSLPLGKQIADVLGCSLEDLIT